MTDTPIRDCSVQFLDETNALLVDGKYLGSVYDCEVCSEVEAGERIAAAWNFTRGIPTEALGKFWPDIRSIAAYAKKIIGMTRFRDSENTYLLPLEQEILSRCEDVLRLCEQRKAAR